MNYFLRGVSSASGNLSARQQCSKSIYALYGQDSGEKKGGRITLDNNASDVILSLYRNHISFFLSRCMTPVPGTHTCIYYCTRT